MEQTIAKRPRKRGLAPSHPGAFLRVEIFDELNLSISEVARHMGVRHATLSDLLNEKSALSPEMAMRFELAFGHCGIDADMLLRMQAARDAFLIQQKAASFGVQQYRPST